MGQRLALTFACQNEFSYLRDIVQAYIQSVTFLERLLYYYPLPEMKIPPGLILRAVKPIYGAPESGLHWFVSYSSNHIKKLGMQQTSTDPCILYKQPESKTKSIDMVILQVDDSFGTGSSSFLEQEDSASKSFQSKPRKIFQVGTKLNFNGGVIHKDTKDSFTLSQIDKLKRIKLSKEPTEQKSIKHQLQYIGSYCRPDILSIAQLLRENDTTKIQSIIDYIKRTLHLVLRFVRLDMDSLRIVTISDSSFNNAGNNYSQMGYLILLVDGNNNANIIQYSSKKCRRVTRSVMAAELLALVSAFDDAFFLQHTLDEILGYKIPIDSYIDSRTTFNCVAKNGPTMEKRLQIDAAALREARDKHELRFLGWIPGPENASDGLTKATILQLNHPLIKLLDSNKFNVRAKGWATSKQKNDHQT